MSDKGESVCGLMKTCVSLFMSTKGSSSPGMRNREKDFSDTVKKLAAGYYERLDDIVRHIAPDLKEMYGVTDPGEIKSKLGKPVIDLTMGEINYLEHTFDYEHIFTLEYLDDEFKQLSHFSVDG